MFLFVWWVFYSFIFYSKFLGFLKKRVWWQNKIQNHKIKSEAIK
ncbi:hypothetical protein C730_07290 [Helicobacter pylori Rif2]|nr:hypothetical protein C694_07280 [Helicobacter pylori 26695]AFV44224.1 hypothetical protein C695_07290 [Helicobacter pylori Rif1]AFV45817.1 hypothetical protein C730_07290 [Helicobacter pylori Rif2]EIE30577.1 hypothetical protein HP2RS_06119 [Helicobacter pylori]